MTTPAYKSTVKMLRNVHFDMGRLRPRKTRSLGASFDADDTPAGTESPKGISGVGEKAVSDASDGGEVGRVGGVVFDVAAEADDEVVDGAGVSVFVDAPDVFEDGFARDDLAGAVGEVAEEVCLHHGEVGGAMRSDELEGIEANGAVVEGVGVGGGFGLGVAGS